MKRPTATALLTLALLFLLIPPSSRVFTQQIKADTASTKTLTIAGLHDRVTVRRDERGIPYIEAKNDEDLYFAQGYVTATDRLW
ncbi:MAG: penicillin acylase family protein, partial [Acidobacteriota bacterium]|nr:penicillin acylase family protein [Acidobacteriota bacterium]